MVHVSCYFQGSHTDRALQIKLKLMKLSVAKDRTTVLVTINEPNPFGLYLKMTCCGETLGESVFLGKPCPQPEITNKL